MSGYSITIAVREEEMVAPIIESLHPLTANILIGKGYDSFSRLVNTVILNSKEEIVIFCSHRVRPTPANIDFMLQKIEEGHGLVGLFRFAFFGFKKELIRRVGFFDETFIGGGYEDNDFVIRLKEANISYYEDECVTYIPGTSTWNYAMTEKVFKSKWDISSKHIIRCKDEAIYNYDLGINTKLKDIETKNLFLPWDMSKKFKFVGYYFDKVFIKALPIHLRNVPPPMETFDHSSMIMMLAKWIRPNLYVEFGVREGNNLMKVAPFCKKVHGIDISPMNVGPDIETFQMTTDAYVEAVLNKSNPKIVIDMIFIDACHESTQVMKDFEGAFPYVIEDGFIILHDTYPYDEIMTQPNLCNDCYKVPILIKEKYGNMCELLTLPFNPGLTIIKKKTNPLPAFLL